jgi:hypothetical protein
MTDPSTVATRRRILQFALAAPAVASLTSQAVAAQAELLLAPATDAMTPFKVSVPQAAIDDLKRRLKNTRWPDQETVSDWSQGVPLHKAKSLVAYWERKYDWRKFD